MQHARLPSVGELQAFVAAVDTRSLSKAAATLRISTTAVAKRLANLEIVLRVSLLERSPQGARPTAGGLLLYPRARRVLNELESIRHLENEQNEGDLLRLHSMMLSAGTVLPETLLAEVETMLGLFFGMSDDALAIASDEGRVYEANEAFCAYFGREKSELVGREFGEAGMSTEPAERERIEAELTEQSRSSGFFEIVTLTGARKRIRLFLFRVYLGGSPHVLLRMTSGLKEA